MQKFGQGIANISIKQIHSHAWSIIQKFLDAADGIFIWWPLLK